MFSWKEDNLGCDEEVCHLQDVFEDRFRFTSTNFRCLPSALKYIIARKMENPTTAHLCEYYLRVLCTLVKYAGLIGGRGLDHTFQGVVGSVLSAIINMSVPPSSLASHLDLLVTVRSTFALGPTQPFCYAIPTPQSHPCNKRGSDLTKCNFEHHSQGH